MAALPTRATIPSAQLPSSFSSKSSASSASSSSSSQSSSPPTASSRLRSFFGINKSSSPLSSSDDLCYGSLPPATFSSYGYLGPHAEVDGHPTHTSNEQLETERKVDQVVEEWKHTAVGVYQPAPSLTLLHDTHLAYLLRSIELLPAGYVSLDASRPWLVYWTLQCLAALNYPIPLPLAQRCVDFLALCQHPTGGYCGGPDQAPHLAPTYAAVNALAILSGVPGVDVAVFTQINRRTMYRFLLRMKRDDGSFSVCDDGECDTRGVYTAVSVASMCGLMSEQLMCGVVDYVQRCQTYEGGMGGEPGNEAHGGYTFCSLAALMMLGRADAVRVEGPRGVRHWTARRQMRREGGFCGRTNKLVDGCYSFWVAALFPLLDILRAAQPATKNGSTPDTRGFDELALQRYILLAGQALTGGLRDKPGKGPDLYHSCYCLSGLSVAQWGHTSPGVAVGGEHNRVRRMNPLYNLPIEDAERLLEWSAAQTKPYPSWLSLP